MPYMTIYLAKDGKWHTRDCPLLPPDTWTNENQIIGSTGMKPGPTRDDMCKKCWSFLFPANSASKESEACSTQFCSKCGKRVEPQECWPIAFPESGSFWRLVCDCGWFGPPADTQDQCVQKSCSKKKKK